MMRSPLCQTIRVAALDFEHAVGRASPLAAGRLGFEFRGET
jgi:hypothetical protein